MNKYSKLFFKSKNFYKSLSPVQCSALQNRTVFFTRTGFNHILIKNGSPRPIKDQIRRFKLLKKVSLVIKESKEILDYRVLLDFEYWTISSFVNVKRIKVVIRKGERSSLHFFSIMG